MATRKNYLYFGGGERLITPTTSTPHFPHFEFNESDLWTSNDVASSSEPKNSIPNSRPSKKNPKRNTENLIDRRPNTGKSLPVNVPDWSKILREEYQNRKREKEYEVGYEEEEEEDEDDKIPPHEYLARTRIASFSVHEGIGRTLKGRDLSRVRNAIWKQTGFED